MSGEKRLRILVVDDHFVVRMGLAGAINCESDMVVAGEAANGREAIEKYRELVPDLVLMDVRLPGPSGVETAEAICKEFPDARIVVLTVSDGDEDIRRAFQAGARGYVLKTFEREELLQAIRTVGAGKRHLPPDIAARLADRLSRPDLTPRELEILEAIVRGNSNKEIGAVLRISEATVKRHVGSVLEKLRVGDRAQAITAAIQRGIVHLD